MPSEEKTVDRPVALDATLNGAKAGTWVFVERGRDLYAPREAFEEWRLNLPPDAPVLVYRGQEYRSLAAIAGYRSKLDPLTQSIELQFAPDAFAILRLTTALEKTPVSAVLPSFFLNYDLSGSITSPRVGASNRDLGLLTEAGFSSPWGVLTHSSAARRFSGTPPEGLTQKWTRLETTFTRDFPTENLTLRIGDTVTSRPMWGRDVYFGGVRFGTNYALSPTFVTQPLPVVAGLSAAPSTVELYVNDVLRQVSSVPTGPFVIDNFPLLNNGEARVIVRDLLGRETVLVQDFFSSSNLLAKGLTDYSVEAGRLRRNLGLVDDEYGPGFASGTYRHGFSDGLTVETRAEYSRKLKLIGAGMLTVLPKSVVMRAALVGTDASGLGGGGHWLVGFESRSARMTASVEVAGSSRNYRELGWDPTANLLTKYQAAGNWSYASDAFGTFGLGFATIERFDGSHISTLSSNYTMRLGATSNVTIVGSRAVAGAQGWSIGASLVVPIDVQTVGSLTTNSRPHQTDVYASAVKNPDISSGWGWRVLQGRQQGQDRAEGGLYYQGERGTYSGDVSIAGDQNAARIGTTGGFIFAQNHFFASRRVDDSFAIVEVPGYGGLGVGIGSNVMTHTDDKGLALVPRLAPYTKNSIRLDPRELPIDAEIESIELDVVPAWRSAVRVAFPVRGGRGALLKIRFADGEEAPAGAILSVAGDKETFYVARRGEAYVTGLKDSDRVKLEWRGQTCMLDVTLPPPNPDQVARVGPLLCKGVAR